MNRFLGETVINIFLFCLIFLFINAYASGQECLNAEETKNQSLQPQKSLEAMFTAQVGAFRNVSNATALATRLYEKGYNSYITFSESKDKEKLYKVCVGKFIDKKLAESLSEKIEKTESLKTVITLSCNTETCEYVSYLLGEINSDGSIDITDVVLSLRIALGLNDHKPCSDINNDKSVDISDVILTLRMALGIDPMKPCT
jgi:hypothetical protein